MVALNHIVHNNLTKTIKNLKMCKMLVVIIAHHSSPKNKELRLCLKKELELDNNNSNRFNNSNNNNSSIKVYNNNSINKTQFNTIKIDKWHKHHLPNLFIIILKDSSIAHNFHLTIMEDFQEHYLQEEPTMINLSFRVFLILGIVLGLKRAIDLEIIYIIWEEISLSLKKICHNQANLMLNNLRKLVNYNRVDKRV